MNPIENIRLHDPLSVSYLPKYVVPTKIYPRCTSPRLLKVRYVRSAPIDRHKLFLAQQVARFAMHCGAEWKDKRNNHANYLLTAAYEGGPENDAFWEQGY